MMYEIQHVVTKFSGVLVEQREIRKTLTGEALPVSLNYLQKSSLTPSNGSKSTLRFALLDSLENLRDGSELSE